MASLKCQQCGFSDINVRNILPKDTPSRIYFLVCAQCGTLARISNLVSLLDHSHQKDPDERSTAHRILETLW